MFIPANGKITNAHVLLAVSLVAFVVFFTTAFQTSQILREREALHQTLQQQETPVQNIARIRDQLNTLAVGTLKLAKKGDHNAKDIIERMKKLGITVHMPKEEAPAPVSGKGNMPERLVPPPGK